MCSLVVLEFDVIRDIFDSVIHVSTQFEELVIDILVYHVCPIVFMEFQTWVNLIIFDMIGLI